MTSGASATEAPTWRRRLPLAMVLAAFAVAAAAGPAAWPGASAAAGGEPAAGALAVADPAAIRARLDALGAEIHEALRSPDGVGARSLTPADPGWVRSEEWKEALFALARMPVDWKAVEHADRDLRAAMDMIFQSRSEDAAARAALIRALQAAPMPALREYGAAKQRMEALRRQPWDLRFTAADGRTVDLAALRGRPVIVAYWSAGCQGSRRQVSKLQTWYRRHHGAGLEIVGLNFDGEDERGETLRFAAEHGLVWPHRIDRAQRREEFDRYGLVWVSNLMLLDNQGRLLRAAPGPDLEAWDGLIREQLARR